VVDIPVDLITLSLETRLHYSPIIGTLEKKRRDDGVSAFLLFLFSGLPSFNGPTTNRIERLSDLDTSNDMNEPQPPLHSVP
jgi:hypothetical protein